MARPVPPADVPFPTASERVYHERFEGTFTPNLDYTMPIDEVLPEAIYGVKTHKRCICVDAWPNTGKSKQLPAVLAERGMRVLTDCLKSRVRNEMYPTPKSCARAEHAHADF